jgi:hypothetical protein
MVCVLKEVATRTCSAKCSWDPYACACDPTTSLCGQTVLVFDNSNLDLARRAVEAYGGIVDRAIDNFALVTKLTAAKKPRVVILELEDYKLDADAERAITAWVAAGGATIYRGFLPTEPLRSAFAARVGTPFEKAQGACAAPPGPALAFGSLVRSGSGPDVFAAPSPVTGLDISWYETTDCYNGFSYTLDHRRSVTSRLAPLSTTDGELIGTSTRVADGTPLPLIALTRRRKVFVHSWQIERFGTPASSKDEYVKLLVNELAFLTRP